MSLNYDPKLNRLREYRFRGVDYDQLRLEAPEDILDFEEYATLVLETKTARMSEGITVGGCFLGLLAFSRYKAYKQINGYLRACLWGGLTAGPWFYLRNANSKALNGLYDDMLLKRLNVAYEEPMSYHRHK